MKEGTREKSSPVHYVSTCQKLIVVLHVPMLGTDWVPTSIPSCPSYHVLGTARIRAVLAFTYIQSFYCRTPPHHPPLTPITSHHQPTRGRLVSLPPPPEPRLFLTSSLPVSATSRPDASTTRRTLFEPQAASSAVPHRLTTVRLRTYAARQAAPPAPCSEPPRQAPTTRPWVRHHHPPNSAPLLCPRDTATAC